jgi:5-deoxy-glucuronate isomerase
MNARVFENGYNVLTEQDGAHKNALMDIGVYVFQPGERSKFLDERNEAAFLLLGGEITVEWLGKTERVARHSVFDERPTALHVPRGMEVWIESSGAAEVLIQKTENANDFAPAFYKASSIKDVFLGEENMQGCAKRILRDIFNYSNAPYSNMVLGEDIHLPGRWSSYPPHHHPQPEVYYYKFDKPQGFGVSIIGDDAAVIMDNHISVITGGLCHPQVTAPGYAMYYVWMIRHLDGNPWTDRVDDPAHSWLHDKEAVIWNGPADRGVI